MPRPLQTFALSLCALAGLSLGTQHPRAPVPEPAARPSPAPATPETRVLAAALVARGIGLGGNEVERLARAIVKESQMRGFDPALVLAVIEVESDFDAFAISPAGAFGLMQIRPATGRALARRLGMPWRGASTLFDPVSNVRLGVAYLQQLRRRFGRLETALAAYNWGPTRVDRRLRRGDPLPAAYPQRVLAACAAECAPVGTS